MLSEDKKKELVKRLSERIASKAGGFRCPMCSNQQFTLADAYVRNELQENLRSVNLGGPSIPAAAIICNNCGFISQHALGVIGLLPKEEDKKPSGKPEKADAKEASNE